MRDIFLSYNREDQARAKIFAEAFETHGFNVWWDVGLRTGEAYDEVTETALRTAKAVVVLWSKKSVVSRWVRAEATLADRNKTLAPCMIEPCERPIMFELTQTAELGHWQGDAADGAWRSFLSDVYRFVAKGGPTPVSTTLAVSTVAVSAPALQAAASGGKPHGARPSIAILSFTNRSTERADEVFAGGMAEGDRLSPRTFLQVLSLGHRCWALYGLGRLDEALEVVTKFVGLDPSFRYALMTHPVFLWARKAEPREGLDYWVGLARGCYMSETMFTSYSQHFIDAWNATPQEAGA